MNLKERFNESFERLKNEAFELNYYLADNPELPGEEFESSKRIVNLLNSHGINTKLGYCDL